MIRPIVDQLIEWGLTVLLALMLAVREVDRPGIPQSTTYPIVFSMERLPDYHVLLCYPQRNTAMFYGVN